MLAPMDRAITLHHFVRRFRRGTVDGGVTGADEAERVVQLRSAGPCPRCGEERLIQAVLVAYSLAFDPGRVERVTCACGTRRRDGADGV